MGHFAVSVEPGPLEGTATTVVRRVDGSERDRSYRFTTGWACGTHYPPFVGPERLAWLKKAVTLREKDVVVVTFAKCGTTFVEQVVLLLLSRGDPSCLDPLHKNAYSAQRGTGKIWCEAALSEDGTFGAFGARGEGTPVSVDEFEAMPDPRVIKTHAVREHLLGLDGDGCVPKGVRLIYVTRNPKDACASRGAAPRSKATCAFFRTHDEVCPLPFRCYYHAFNPHREGWPFAAWAAAWAAGAVPSGSWFDHARDWFHAEFRDASKDRLWIHYEDLIADPLQAVRRVAELLWPDGPPAWLDADVLDAVVRHSTFDSMRLQVDAAAKQRSDNGEAVWAAKGHLRKGAVGDWRAPGHFSPQLSDDFDRLFERKLAGTGLRYDQGPEAPPLCASKA